MNRPISLPAMILMTASVLLLSCGCEKRGSTEGPGADAGPGAPASSAQGDLSTGDPNNGVVVNSVSISLEAIKAVAAPYLAQIDQAAAQQPAMAVQQRKRDVIAKVVKKVIIDELLQQEAKRQGIEASEEDVDETIENLAFNLEPPLRVEEYIANAEAGGTSLAELREQARRGFIVGRLLDAATEGKVQVTEADARRYYDNTPKEFIRPENILVSHILIEPQAGSKDPKEARQAARRTIEDIREKLEAGGDFEALARAYSTCESRIRGGSLGYVKRGILSPEFDEAAFALDVNEVSDVVEASYGFHIIKVLEHNGEGVFTFEEVRDDVIHQLEEDRRLDVTRQYILQLEAAAHITDYTVGGTKIRL